MKLVRSEAELVEQIQSGKREAQQFFGNSKVLLEKYFDKTRHIEVQIMGNHRDQVKNSTSLENGLCIFERDCSIQRRYQKIIEETPAVCVSAPFSSSSPSCLHRSRINSTPIPRRSSTSLSMRAPVPSSSSWTLPRSRTPRSILWK